MLNLDQLEDFEKFCKAKGWEKVPTKGEWEILRMQHQDDNGYPLIAHKRPRWNQITFHGERLRLAMEYYNEVVIADWNPTDEECEVMMEKENRRYENEERGL